MIALDTSAIMAVLLSEPEAEACISGLESADEIVMSAASLAETLIVAARRNLASEAEQLVTGLAVDVVPVTAATAARVAGVYARWGKGLHPAGLNFGDCFAYDVADQHACPLLFVGRDFSLTDIRSVLQGDDPA